MGYFQKVCFTLNNYTEEEELTLYNHEAWTYIVIGKEVGSEGTPHLQGYGELKSRRQMKFLKTISIRCHWEKLKSTAIAASNYCKKDGVWSERGTLSINESGKKELCEWIKFIQEKNMREMLAAPPNISTIKVMEKYLTYCEKERNYKPEVTWIWGASGCGKSRMAQDLAGTDAYWKDGEKWWDGYDSHESVILDDFRASNMKFNYLLRLLDRYPMRVEVKGGYRQMISKKIFVTTIVHPQNVYQLGDNDEPIKQLIRRIDNIIEANKKTSLSCDEVMEEEEEKAVVVENRGNTNARFYSLSDITNRILNAQ